MIIINRQFHKINIREYWFTYQSKLFNPFSLSAFMFIRDCNIKFPLGVKHIHETVENSLEISNEEIFSKFSPSNRTKIRKAEKEGVICHFENDLEKFINFYNEFAAQKNISLISAKQLNPWKDDLAISFATLNETILAAHQYQVDESERIVRGAFFGNARFTEKEMSAIATKANRLLHYRDMLYFKEKGIKFYNWGGYFDMEGKPKPIPGLLEFKLSFGGEKINYCDYYSFGYYYLRKTAKLFGLVG